MWDISSTNTLVKWGLICLVSGATVIYALIKFRKVLEGLLGRTQQIGIASFSPAQSEATRREDASPATQFANAPDTVLRPYFEELAQRMEGDLRPKYPDAELRALHLARLAAIFSGQSQFDYLNFYIYGSQIRALMRANVAPLSRIEMMSFYEEGVAASPQTYSNYLFDQWLDYMANHELIKPMPHDCFSVTEKGKEFLRHMIDRHYPLDRSN